MKRRLFYLAPVLLILFTIAAGLVRPARVSAAASTEQYMINFLPSQQAAIDSCLRDHNCDRTASSDMYNVALLAKGGVYGSTPFELDYEPNVDSGILNSDQFAFTGNYTCGGMAVSLLVTIDMGSLEQVAYPSKVFIDNIRNNTTGEDSNGIATGSDGSQVDVPLSYPDISQGLPGAPTAKLPGSCLPRGLNTPSGGDDYSGSRYVSVNNYTKMNATQQATWGTLGANPTYGNPSGAGGSSNNFVCNTGTDILGFIPNPLDFILCGIINGAYLIVSNLDKQINNWLAIGTTSTATDDPNQIFADGNSCPGGGSSCKAFQNANAYEQAWAQFRNIALGLLVIVGLIIVISQALGMEILDAYTIRKMLPRVLIATIAITLSWQLMRLAVIVSNDLGYGVGSLISKPFARIGIDIRFNTGGSVLTAFAAAGSVAVFDLFGLLGFVGTAVVAVLITFIVLILRQIAVILLIILAPVALIAYVLPNTQRVYKFWWESFSKMLLMFPMIVGLITAGHIFSAIASQNPSLVNQVIAIIAYFAPYFMIPLTFRFSGAIMSTMGNAVNARGEPARGALRNMRSNRAKQNMAKLQAGTRFEGKKWIPGSIKAATKFGDVSRGVGTGWNGRFGFRQRGENAQANVLQAAAENAMKEPGMQAIKGKNDFNRVLAEGMGDERRGHAKLMEHLQHGGDDGQTFLSEADARTRADAAVIGAKVAGGFTKAHGIAAFKNMARDGTAIRDTEDLARLAALAGDGNGNNTFTFAAEAATISGQVGRPDLKPSTEAIGELAFRESDKEFNHGNAKLYTGNKDDQHLLTASRLSAYGNTQAYERFTQAKGRALRSDHAFLAEVVSDTSGKYSLDEKQKAAAHMADARSAIASGLGAVNKREEAAKAMADATEAHDQYMKQETGGTVREETPKQEYVETAPGVRERKERNSDVIAEKFGGRPSRQGMTPEQIAEEANRNRPEEQDQQ